MTIPLFEDAYNGISLQTAVDMGYFGPVYHGTTKDNISSIKSFGFKISKLTDKSKKNSYNLVEYYAGCAMPPPTDHLGNGIYFTTVKNIAKEFAGRSTMDEYYLDVKNIETINFASPRKMMDWWISNGYDVKLAKEALSTNNIDLWVKATDSLTKTLSEKYDAVYFKGSSMTRLLDGNQICVFDTSKIYHIDNTLASGLQLGSKVVAVADICSKLSGDNKLKVDVKKGTKGVILDKRNFGELHLKWLRDNRGDIDIYKHELKDKGFNDVDIEYYIEMLKHQLYGDDDNYYVVKFVKGGKQSNVMSYQISPI